MRYEAYTTTHDRHRIWTDVLIESVPAPKWLTVSLCGALLFVAGAAVAIPYGFFDHYTRTPAIYIGCLGVALVIGAVHWASLQVHRAYEQLRPIFTMKDAAYLEVTTKWFRRFSNTSLAFVFWLILFPLVPVAVFFAYYVPPEFRQRYNIDSLRPRSFTAPWYFSEFELVAQLELLVLGGLITFVLGSSMGLLLLNHGFLLRLRHLPVIPVPALVRARLRPMVDLYVRVSFAWSAGVVLFVAAFYGTYDVFSLGTIISLLIVGVATFSIPQLVCRRFIINSYDRLCALGFVWVYGRLGVLLKERDRVEGRAVSIVANSIAELTQTLERPKTWVYEGRDLVLVFFGQLLAFLAILAQSVVAKL